MQKKFLEEIADFIIGKYGWQLHDLAVITPNRRAGLFLKKYLGNKTTKPFFAPKIFSIEDFVFHTTGYQKASATDLVFELYDIYLNLKNDNDQSFDDFSSWAPRLINDFNDIDNYLADNQIVFSYLKEARNLQKWNLDKPNLTDIEKNYLNFYSSLKIYYARLREKLRDLNVAYNGMAIRELTENIENFNMPAKHFVIAGFNALTTAEQKLFEFLVNNYKADIFWDADSYYLNDKMQEASKFIRRNVNNSTLRGRTIESNGFVSATDKIEIIGAPGDYPMVKYTAYKLNNKHSLKDTAIILADESLLFPLLNSLSQRELNNLNITMSFPFRRSEIYDMTIRIMEIFESAARLTEQTTSLSGEISFYYKPVVKLLNTPIIKKTYGRNSKHIINNINKTNTTLLTITKLTEFAKNEPGNIIPFELLKTNSLKANEILKAVSDFLAHFTGKTNPKNMDSRFMKINDEVISSLIKKLEQRDVVESPATVKKLYKILTGINGLPFMGTPLTDLQVMGMLETRTLDFKNIIYLSFNEGVIPRNNQFKSFILPEIRREYGLPLPADDDAVAAYHFYRSIQRAENVTLIFNTEPGPMGGGEISRFGLQMIYELSEINPKIFKSHKHSGDKKFQKPKYDSIIDTVILPAPVNQPVDPITVEKNDDIYTKLLETGTNEKKGLSPSSLTEYISCSLKFYFHKILKIRKPDEVEEEIASNTRGSAIHDVLYKLYMKEAREGGNFDDVFFDKALKNYPAMLEAEYRDKYKNGDTEHGNNLLLKKLDDKMIRDFLTAERKYSRGIQDVECEIELSHRFEIKTNDKNIKVRVHGFADRIDTLNGKRRIIDYKTGKTEEKDLNLYDHRKDNKGKKWEQMFSDNKFPKAFQLLTYALIFNRERKTDENITPLIAGLKSKQLYFNLKFNDNKTVDKDLLNDFESRLITLLEEIFDRNIPFRQTENEDACKYCDFQTICGRIPKEKK